MFSSVLIDRLRPHQVALMFIACALVLPTGLYDFGLLPPSMYRTLGPSLLLRLIALFGMAVFALGFALDTGRRRVLGLIVVVFAIASVSANIGKDAYRGGFIADTYPNDVKPVRFYPAEPYVDAPDAGYERDPTVKHNPATDEPIGDLYAPPGKKPTYYDNPDAPWYAPDDPRPIPTPTRVAAGVALGAIVTALILRRRNRRRDHPKTSV